MSLLVTAVLAPTATAAAPGYDWCTGPISIDYLGAAQELLFTRNNHSMPGSEIYWSGPVAADARSVSPGMEDTVSPSGARQNGRAYLSESCTDGQYDPSAYARFQLLDRALSWTVDLSAATCGCDATIYLVSMAQNDDPSGCGDYYCDANSVCGVACTEMDVMEANVGAFLTTAHAASDPSGAAAGLGGGEPGVWSGPRDLTSADYGPSPNATINTLLPFRASASFPTDPASGLLASVDMILSQGVGREVAYSLTGYGGFEELTAALRAGMTPVVSYWSSDGMSWMDGSGSDGQGFCDAEDPAACGAAITISDIAVTVM